MLTTVAWSQSVDPAGAFVQLNAVADQHVRVSGADIQCPALANCVALAGGAENTVAPIMRFSSPSQRRRTTTYVAPINTGAAAAVEPATPPAVLDLRASPIPLVIGEQLNAELNSNPAAAQIQWMVAWLSDAAITPVTGPMFTVRATATTTLVAQAWSNCPITLTEDLPRGRYQLVGLHAISAGMIAARAVFVGGTWRPGCLGGDTVADIISPFFRYGQMGVMGEFEDTDQPTIDVLSVSADTAEEFFLDLIQLRDGPA